MHFTWYMLMQLFVRCSQNPWLVWSSTNLMLMVSLPGETHKQKWLEQLKTNCKMILRLHFITGFSLPHPLHTIHPHVTCEMIAESLNCGVKYTCYVKDFWPWWETQTATTRDAIERLQNDIQVWNSNFIKGFCPQYFIHLTWYCPMH